MNPYQSPEPEIEEKGWSFDPFIILLVVLMPITVVYMMYKGERPYSLREEILMEVITRLQVMVITGIFIWLLLRSILS